MNFGSLASTAVKANQLGVNLSAGLNSTGLGSTGLGSTGQSSLIQNNITNALDSAKSAKSSLMGLTVTKTLDGLNSFGQHKTKAMRSFSERNQNKTMQTSLNTMGILSKKV